MEYKSAARWLLLAFWAAIAVGSSIALVLSAEFRSSWFSVVYVGIAIGLTIFGLIRIPQAGVAREGNSLTIRNFLTTHHVAVNEIDAVGLPRTAAWIGARDAWSWSPYLVLTDGRRIPMAGLSIPWFKVPTKPARKLAEDLGLQIAQR